ncbi:MAG: sulfotransferase, partial [Steroidobacteraceae bacterium]
MKHEPLTVGHLIARACKEAEVERFGSPVFLPALRKLVESINEVLDQLHERGRIGIEDTIIRLLVNRLRMQRDLEQHPEILAEVLQPPAAIIGLPRTGTTKLQRLVAAGRGFQELLMWQGFNPAPFSTPELDGRDSRIDAAAKFVRWVENDAPDSHKGHTMIVEGVEEEHHLLDQTFQSPSMVSFAP